MSVSSSFATAASYSSSTTALETSPSSPTVNVQSGTPKAPLLSNSLIQKLADRALRLPNPSNEPTYHAPSETVSSMTAGSAHILYYGGTRFKALFIEKHLEDEMFRSVHEGILLDYTTTAQTVQKVAVRALHPDKEPSRKTLRDQEMHLHVVNKIKELQLQDSVLVTEPSVPFGHLWTSPLPLCNLLEATKEKPPQQWLPYIKQVVSTLEWLHKKKHIHGKVIPENIVLMPSKTDPNAPPQAHLRDFDYCMRRGYSNVGIALEDPCSHFSIASLLTDIYGLTATLAILFSDSRKPITGDFLKAECEKYITEFLQTGTIAVDLNAPLEYPFQKAIKFICYEQLAVIFSVLRSKPLIEEDLNDPKNKYGHFYGETKRENNSKKWLFSRTQLTKEQLTKPHPETFESIKEVLKTYHDHPNLFTQEAIQLAEDTVANQFREKQIPLIRFPDLLRAVETYVKKKEKETKEIEEMEAILFPSRQQQSNQTKPSTANTSVLQYPSSSATSGSSSTVARENFKAISPTVRTPSRSPASVTAAAAVSSSAMKTPQQNFSLPDRNPLMGSNEEPLVFQGLPVRMPKRNSIAAVHPQQQQSVVHSATYGSFVAPVLHNSSIGLPPRTRRGNTPGPGTTNRQQQQVLPQNGLGNSTHSTSAAFGVIWKK